MKVSKKLLNIAYIILCVILLIGLFAGIKYIVDLGDRLGNTGDEIKWNDNSKKTDVDGLITQQLSASATSYEISIPYGNVSINQTDKDPYVTFSSKRDIKIQTNENNGLSKLKVVTKNKFLNFDSDDVKINFFLPKEKLTSLSVNLEAGILSINQLQADRFFIDVSAGSAVVRDCKFETIKTDVDVGNLELYTNDSTQSINSSVSAGNMKLMLPSNIKGFNINYDVEVGNIENNLSFNIGNSGDGFGVDKSGSISYGDKSCKIDLDLEVGNISINEY